MSKLKNVHSLDDLRRIASRRLPRMVREFVDGGADREETLRSNTGDFDAIRFEPRYLVDVSERDQAVEVFGERVSMPVGLAPAGLARLVHGKGELAAARAAGEAGTIFAVSTASSYSLEEIAEAATGPLWFQLYLWRDRDVVQSLLDRAAESGYQALCLTADVPIVGKRVRDLHNGMTIPPKVSIGNALDVARRPRWMADALTGPKITFANFVGMTESDDVTSLASYVNRDLINPRADWSDLAWVRKRWDGPLVVKGILTAADAERAMQHGADGVVVSNHGGRQLDGAPSAISALERVSAAVEGRGQVFLDGGVRNGADVVRAKALGASMAFVGRPWFWGLAVAGEPGVSQMLSILSEEIDRTLALIGVARFGDVSREAVS